MGNNSLTLKASSVIGPGAAFLPASAGLCGMVVQRWTVPDQSLYGGQAGSIRPVQVPNPMR